MIKISKDNEHETTIIITTHYIEEARQADYSLYRITVYSGLQFIQG
jgi:ABC-type multidrug transport system ATPase subunit